ncbi:HAD superfamily ATPase [Leptolyngbya boryana NIES-2135]|jgi:cation-transporting ATPase E|uniref:HAD superfamily ATPase n=1 Tax=Leptolyngbya boryana NIES-2135 TaxID=1973484 RepID=A0A1Z4JNR1_LEPBY|nr:MULTISPECIES: HAD-IC family P-type ATPase [Leptolyngbya]BAY58392.1 HAD superfamily ATPase [Leptolyngbya boryana NIES-2135]MBD2368066.1 HAD-IC family P-type ATPase [Leptolyngbya sp. FACHB-161]MBD2374590.1 HAD-IC family P-type ATPase [Leptolyngbya sp. FACHB-238]MBD2399012.1 HAD-IC family P-type ATPase [Leptolyngbya sp. FACHB-239]MBD2405401.1 HAD-IC family P-type ATPase [Leptolyngbya sp. FACHB-402]
MAMLPGLSDREVRDQQLAGNTNDVKLPTSRSYARILQENLFTFVNAVFFAISGVFILLQRPSDAVFVAVIIFSGVVIGIVQEIWAKQKLDEIALLNRPHATVIRNGQEVNIDPCAIVLGDVLVLRPGDQVLVDGQIVGEGRVEIDESLLTGESDLIVKVAEKPVYSGSFCVSGTACYEAQKVGADTVAYQLTVGAREFRQVYTPLQAEINLIIRILLLLASFLWLLVGISFISRSQTLNEVVQRAAVIAGLIPAGLLLAITLAYAMGAIRMLGQNVLIQQTNAVESLSNIDVLCLDKTGTLTTNQIELHSLHPLGIPEEELKWLIGDFAASTASGNRTSEAVLIACSGYAKPIRNEIPFSSARKWSAIAFENLPGTYVMGAPEILMKSIAVTDEILNYIDEQVNQGFRVVLFAHTEFEIETTLPPLNPLGILCFSDQLRPSAQETLQGFVKAGITLKIISGDNPQTVAALAKQAGFTDEVRVISGAELAQMDDAQFVQAARNYNVFGRITPQQKAQLVRSLRRSGSYVAMTGDGVNDVLSLKQANLGIAMESGSKATRSIADIVLLKDTFEALPHTFLEGQRIQNGIRDVVKLFMVRLSCVALLIFAIAIVSDSFPLLNKHSAIVTLIGVGIPTTFIPIWAQPGECQKRSLVRSMLHFVIPATITITLVSLTVYLFYLVSAALDLPPNIGLTKIEFNIPRTALVTILVFCELLLIPFLKPPTTAWVGGEPLSGDWRYTWVALALLVVYLLILFIPPLRTFFELSQISVQDCLFLGLVALEWGLIVRLAWRTRFLDRFLGVDLE